MIISVTLYLFHMMGLPAPYTIAAIGILNTALFERFKSLTPGTAASAMFGVCAIVQSIVAGYQLV